MVKSRFIYRFLKLNFGLAIYGAGLGMMVHAGIGIPPWDVLAQGLSLQTSLSFGQATIAVSLIVMLFWIPLRVRPGIGSVLNAILVGLFADITMPLLPDFDLYWQNVLLFIGGLLAISFATGLYISCGFGKGPRDGLMMGLAQKFNQPFWITRTSVEIIVVTIGFLLGGQVREGTLIFALSIGYLNQLAMRLFGLADKSGRV
ncbi:MAG: hypothetical protein P8H20_03065 [Aquiluna sp.]|nr:hypothetical protein [Aquiluna sp.]